MDSDGQHNPNDIYHLIKPLLNEEADITVGSRYLGKCNFHIPFYTKIGEKMIEKTLQFLFNLEVHNNQNGYRAFKRKTLDIFKNFKFKDFAFTTEVLLKAGLNGYRIKEIPIVAEPRENGTSKVKLFKILISLSSCLLHYFPIGLRDKIFKKIKPVHYKFFKS